MTSNEEISLYLYNTIPKNQINDVFNDYYAAAAISPDFLGFVDIYYNLSKIIPIHWTIIDFGCGYNAQCFLFENHCKYISVDQSPNKKFKSENCLIYNMSIREFLNIYYRELKKDLDFIFAICSYVPSKENRMVRYLFKNIYIFYPSGKKEVDFPKLKNRIRRK